jgi:hypothetical protein
VGATARTAAALLIALGALAAPASASQVLEYRHGALVPREDPYLPPPDGPEAALAKAEQACGAPAPRLRVAPRVTQAGPSVLQAIATARRRGSISASDADSYRAAYRGALNTRGRLTRWRGELSSVIATLQGIAARGRLSAGRMPALFLQLRRNTQFWAGDPSFPRRPDIAREPCTPPPTGTSSHSGSRITFSGSRLVFQYYPGQGLQLQPLGNWGMANGMAKACLRKPQGCDRAALRQFLSELLAIRSSRGGFTTWEYWFHFSGGTPPWTSGMSQATAIQALARASQPAVLGDRSYLRVARRALGAFRKAPPVGVRVRSGRGAHYLLYSFAPGLRVLNGFLQAITGLYDYARISGDRTARALYRAGDRAARADLPHFDTGAWSLYSRGGAEATGGYHKLVTGFLGNLCQRLHGRYCVYRDRFRRYSKTAPAIRYQGRRGATAGRPLALRFSVNKVSCVTADVTAADGGHVFHARLKVARGGHAFSWRPRARGRYTLALEARDLLKNRRVVTRTISVR